ncbi:MAG: hypothetical protein FE78DRAFT_29682 [Acidomyces sp. 'richmondensis']|nr:MAG: hypothetical protein FE78DRAFT_29682 [Acidomyces sp. 'richmondensis']
MFRQAYSATTPERTGVDWCRVVPCGVVWCRVVPCGAVWCRVVPCGAVRCCVVLCGADGIRFRVGSKRLVKITSGTRTGRGSAGGASAGRDPCVNPAVLTAVLRSPGSRRWQNSGRRGWVLVEAAALAAVVVVVVDVEECEHARNLWGNRKDKSGDGEFDDETLHFHGRAPP